MKNVNVYEKEITISSMWASLKNNFIKILCFAFVFICFGTIYINVTPKSYKTSGQLVNKTVITTATLNTITGAIKSDDVLDATISCFLDNGIYHKNGSTITRNELVSSLVIPSSNNSCYLEISLISNDSSWMQRGLNSLLDETIKVLKNGDYSINFSNIGIASKATNPINISNSNKKMIFLIVSGFALGMFVPFVFDLKYDLINDVIDVKNLCGSNVVEFCYAKGKKENGKE